VLETIFGLRRTTLDEQQVGVGESIQRCLKRRLINFGDLAQQRIDEIASKNRADLRHLARRAQPIEARGKRLLQGWRDGLNTALLAAFNKQTRDLLYE
jgi:hypothetical protein